MFAVLFAGGLVGYGVGYLSAIGDIRGVYEDAYTKGHTEGYIKGVNDTVDEFLKAHGRPKVPVKPPARNPIKPLPVEPVA